VIVTGCVVVSVVVTGCVVVSVVVTGSVTVVVNGTEVVSVVVTGTVVVSVVVTGTVIVLFPVEVRQTPPEMHDAWGAACALASTSIGPAMTAASAAQPPRMPRSCLFWGIIVIAARLSSNSVCRIYPSTKKTLHTLKAACHRR
jgi:hypothetical protein